MSGVFAFHHPFATSKKEAVVFNHPDLLYFNREEDPEHRRIKMDGTSDKGTNTLPYSFLMKNKRRTQNG
jgi:hypothetical protein